MYSINPERTEENIKEEKEFMKEEISTVEDTCTVYIKDENAKEESTEVQGIINSLIYTYKIVIFV